MKALGHRRLSLVNGILAALMLSIWLSTFDNLVLGLGLLNIFCCVRERHEGNRTPAITVLTKQDLT